jgi:hypothetical protein
MLTSGQISMVTNKEEEAAVMLTKSFAVTRSISTP